MEDRNCELLFEYLKSILYDSQIKKLDVEKLDEPFRKLGLGLQFLQKAVEEMKSYTEDLSKGNLSGTLPGRDNFLCANLKNLHSNLNHLTWQAKQVAAGDYSQEVSYLGEFSDAFNQMIRQLDEREKLLTAEKELTEKRLTSKAYYDSATGIRNRLYFMEYLEKIIFEEQDATLCYIDLDGLKFVNDHFGHAEGDAYIMSFVKEIQQAFHENNIFARIGGDEFCVIVSGCVGETVSQKLKASRTHFMESNKKDYPVSFSYGVYEILGEDNCLTLEEIIDTADRKMYAFKKKYKESRNV